MKKYKLLQYHMNCNSDYMFGHAIVAGLLASKQLTTLELYKQACSEQGIDCYPGAWEQWAIDVNLS